MTKKDERNSSLTIDQLVIFVLTSIGWEKKLKESVYILPESQKVDQQVET